LTRRLALITGGSRGIGAAAAIRLAEDGIDVIVQYHRAAEAAEAVCARCRGYGVRAEAAQADLREGESVHAIGERLSRTGRMPDIVVHSAGTAYYGLLEDCGEDVWDDLMGVHLKAAYRLTRMFAPAMAWRRWGRIVYLSSVWGLVGASGEAAYAAAKGGINSFAKSMARELASAGVTVNAVAPGAIATDMLAGLSAEETEALCAEIPLGRLGQPEEVAELIRFLVSEDAGYITGQVLGISGGWPA